jgi:general secretion pathway protein B
MSYILDALRRADAERERGTVPSLHTQQFGVLPGDDEVPARPRLLVGAVVVLALVLAAVIAWLYFGSSEPPPKPTQTVATAPTPPFVAPPVAAPVVPALPAMTAPAASAAPAVTPSTAHRPPSSPTAAAPAARPAPAPRPAARREPAPTTPATTPGTAPADERIYSLSELPEAIRRELPKIAYGGGSYSPDKASRMAFLNGQVFHEGDTIAPGLVLKQVRQKGAILAYKGYRFEIGP